jgi:3-dehydroquinate synthase
MCLEARLSQLLGIIDKEHVQRIKALIDSYGLPSEMPADINLGDLLPAMKLDKKAVAGVLKCILPEKIGKVRIQKEVSEKDIRDSFQS